MAVSTIVQECSEQALAEGRGQVFYLRIKDKYIYGKLKSHVLFSLHRNLKAIHVSDC